MYPENRNAAALRNTVIIVVRTGSAIIVENRNPILHVDKSNKRSEQKYSRSLPAMNIPLNG